MSCCDVNQLRSGLHSLELSAANAPPHSQHYRSRNPSMNLDASLSQSMMGKQDNQNAAALSLDEGVSQLLQRTNYLITKENGQRRYGPPPDWSAEVPPRGCEVFIGKIPRDCFEDELVPIFESAGKIYMFRLMMEFNGQNRGYGFCIYTNKEDAKVAVEKLNNYEIRKGKALGVCLSVDNCRLFVGGIPKSKTREEIFVEMCEVTEGVRDVICYPSVADKTKNRGFAFVEYESHKAAAMARRKLIPGRIQLWGQQIAVDWAEPEREVNEDIMSRVKILYVRNLMLATSEDQLRSLFLEVANSGDQAIERVKKISDYAFVHFKDREVAQKCLECLNGTQIDGSTVEVTWAKPADKDEPVRSQRTGKSLMDWNLGSDIANYFIDPSTAIIQGGNPFLVPGTSPNRGGSSRMGRRNAAGGRSAAAQRERKHPVEKLQQHQFNPMTYQEIMEDFCQRNGLEPPIYMALPIDVVDCNCNEKIQLFIGRVVIPSLRLQYITPRYYSTGEEAKIAAAETAVYNLQYNQMQMAITEFSGSSGLDSDDQLSELGSVERLSSKVKTSKLRRRRDGKKTRNSNMKKCHPNSPAERHLPKRQNSRLPRRYNERPCAFTPVSVDGAMAYGEFPQDPTLVDQFDQFGGGGGGGGYDLFDLRQFAPTPSMASSDDLGSHLWYNQNIYGPPSGKNEMSLMYPQTPTPTMSTPPYPPSMSGLQRPCACYSITDQQSPQPCYMNTTQQSMMLSGIHPHPSGLADDFSNPPPSMTPMSGGLQSSGNATGLLQSVQSSSLLPVILPQNMQQNRNLAFHNGLYESSAGTLPPMMSLPGLTMQNQLFDYQHQLMPNPMTASTMLQCGGLISPATLVVDPSLMGLATSTNGMHQPRISSAPIDMLTDLQGKPMVSHNGSFGYETLAPTSLICSVAGAHPMNLSLSTSLPINMSAAGLNTLGGVSDTTTTGPGNSTAAAAATSILSGFNGTKSC